MKLFTKVKDYFAARDIPYDLIRGIITATCGVLLGLLSSSYINSINKKRQYRQLVLNAVYDMNRTCLQSQAICRSFHKTDSLYALADSLYSSSPSLVADSTASELMSIFIMPLHPLNYNTIEGVLREDMQSFEKIDDIELESMMNDFYSLRDQFLEIFHEHNRKAEDVANVFLQNVSGYGCGEKLSAVMASAHARMFFMDQHPEYTALLVARCKDMEELFADILEEANISIEDLNDLSMKKSGKPIRVINRYLNHADKKHGITGH